jgi:hypothetical protein
MMKIKKKYIINRLDIINLLVKIVKINKSNLMFWGCTLKQGSNVKYTESALFHLSNICLVSQGKANVVA